MPFSSSSANIKVAALGILLGLSIVAAAGLRLPAKEAQEKMGTSPYFRSTGNRETSPFSPVPPLSVAQQGYFFAGRMYVEYQIPARRAHPYPIVMIHGLWQSGTNFTGTPDGREGWAQYFLRQGYAVYVVDQPGRGRSSYDPMTDPALRQPDIEDAQRRFVAPERYNLWPQAHLHTQWPGKGAPGDPIFDQFFASQLPSIGDNTVQTRMTRDAAVALLDKIGPSIVLTHSQSGAFGWPIADARPDLVKAIVAVEPSGPPFYNTDIAPAPEWFRDSATQQRRWGVTDVPLTYSPPVSDPSQLVTERQGKPDGPDLVRCWLQKAPAHQLPNLQKIPILILTAEASYHAPYDHCTAKYLEQAGAHPMHVRLALANIHGNGHMMMLEKNNAVIAGLIERWLRDR